MARTLEVRQRNETPQQKRILAALLGAPHGLTDFELSQRTEIYLSSINSARNALLKQGRVRSSGRLRPSGRGGHATVWILA